jgi:hypothetical protein
MSAESTFRRRLARTQRARRRRPEDVEPVEPDTPRRPLVSQGVRSRTFPGSLSRVDVDARLREAIWASRSGSVWQRL